MMNTRLKVKVADHNPKVDHNITLAGLLVTDANTVNQKMEREEEGILKGLYAFKKKIPTGEVYICNGAEFPNAEAVDLLLYLVVQLEEIGWNRNLSFKSISQLLKDVFGVGVSKFWIKKLKRLLVIWKNHSFYFPNSFIWHGEKTESYFGVIENFNIKHQGKGKPAKVEIIFDDKFLEICKETDWYRRPPWLEIRKLRKEVAKRLYILALEYKPKENSEEWKIYIDGNLKHWYRNAMNSLANPKYLKPYYVLARINGAIEEINAKTNLRMSLQKAEEGNYYIAVEEVTIPGVEKVKIPFDSLPEKEKTTLIAYAGAIAKEKKIKNIWGFLRSMNSRQVKLWLNRAKRYFSKVQEDRKPKQSKEQPKLSLKDKISKVIRAFGLSDEYLICEDNDNEYVIYLSGISLRKVKELNANREFINTLVGIVGKPVRIA